MSMGMNMGTLHLSLRNPEDESEAMTRPTTLAELRYHQEKQADLTIGALRVTQNEARAFGVMQVDNEQRICGFSEKPDNPECIPGDPGYCL